MKTLLGAVIALMIVLLPLTRYQLALNSAPADIFGATAIFLSVLYLARTGLRVRFPLVLPIALIVLASLLSMFNAEEPAKAAVALMKECYLFVLFFSLSAIFANIDEKLFNRLLFIWIGMAMLHGLVIIAQFFSPSLLYSMTTDLPKYYLRGSFRPVGLLSNPNMAGAYQAISFLPLLMVGRAAWLIVGGMVLLGSIAATGSNAAYMSVLAGFLVYLAGTIVAQRTLFARLRRFAAWAGGVIILLSAVAIMYLQFQDPSRIYEISISRLEAGLSKRLAIWTQGFDVWERSRAFGIGVANFEDAEYAVSLHNDLLAFLVERGIVGALSLLFFGFSYARILLRSSSLLSGGRGRPMAVIFSAVAVVIAVASLTHQVFHFRFVWIALAFQIGYLSRAYAMSRLHVEPGGNWARVNRGPVPRRSTYARS